MVGRSLKTSTPWMIAALNQQRSAKGIAVGGDGKVLFSPSDVGRDMNRGRLGPQLHEGCRQQGLHHPVAQKR